MDFTAAFPLSIIDTQAAAKRIAGIDRVDTGHPEPSITAGRQRDILPLYRSRLKQRSLS